MSENITTKFTRGPWRVFFPRGGTGGIRPGIDSDSRSIVVYGYDGTDHVHPDDSCGIQGGGKAEELANAALIAAAPRLFDALEQALSVLRQDFPPEEYASWHGIAVKEAEEALRQASEEIRL